MSTWADAVAFAVYGLAFAFCAGLGVAPPLQAMSVMLTVACLWASAVSAIMAERTKTLRRREWLSDNYEQRKCEQG